VLATGKGVGTPNAELGAEPQEAAIQPSRHPDLEPATEPPAPTTDLGSDSEGIGRRSARGFLWGTLAWTGNRLAILGLTLLLARLLAPEDFGVVTAALTVIAILDAALDLGVGAAVIAEQETGVTRRTRTAFTLNLAIAVLVCLTGVACAPLIASAFQAPAAAPIFALIFLYPLFRGAGQVHDAVLKRDLRFRARTGVDLTRAAVRVVVSVPLALSVGGAVSIAAGIVASELVAMVLLWVLVPIRPELRPDRTTVRGLLGFGGQVTVIRILGSLRSNLDYVAVGAVLGATALGFYGIGYKLPELAIENVLWIFSAIALSAYARAYANGRAALLDTMLKATRLLALYGLAAGTALAVVAPDAIPVLFSAQWMPAVIPAALIALSLGVAAIPWASGDVFAALGRPGTLILLDIPATALMAVAFVFAPRWGLVGVALVHLVFNLGYCVARLAVLRAVTRVRVRSLLAAILPGLAVAALTAAVGGGVAALLPSGRLVTLLLVSAACALAIAAGSFLFARSVVVEAWRLVRPARPAAA
jgi:PST family polysaccharide transporter